MGRRFKTTEQIQAELRAIEQGPVELSFAIRAAQGVNVPRPDSISIARWAAMVSFLRDKGLPKGF